MISDIKTGSAYALMKNHIYSTFDLSKSLENFQEQVTKLLELKNISEWDGRVFREREQKIREFALIMAGECTALLLHNLSKSQAFLDKAEQETRGWWQTTTQKHGCKKRQILTVGNIEVSLKLPYVVERRTQSKKNQKSLHEGFCPGQALDLMRNMGEFISEANGERLKILVRKRNYILKAYRRRLLRYNEVASRKLPLGSGAS